MEIEYEIERYEIYEIEVCQSSRLCTSSRLCNSVDVKVSVSLGGVHFLLTAGVAVAPTTSTIAVKLA